MYTLLQLCTLLMKGRVPTKRDIQRTLFGILQSTAFLSFTGFGYSFFLCTLRRVMGHFNLLTVSFFPAFLSSVFAILIERPSRRTLLCLYVSNVATETVWNMALSRGLVRNVPYGDVAIFGASMAVLLTYYKGGHHSSVPDAMFKILRFVVGPYEEKDFGARVTHEANTFYRQQVVCNDGSRTLRAPEGGAPRPMYGTKKHKNAVWHLVVQMLRIYKKLIYRVKCFGRHQACPHPFSCFYYVLGGTGKMFSVGLGIQITLKLVLNMKKIASSPKAFQQIFLKKNILNLGLFLGLYSGLFRGSLCVLRRIFGRDDPAFAFPASMLASVAFKKYPDTTVALYITYNIGTQKGLVPRVPGFPEFLYCLSTGILFHAALLEPTNLRPSYWKFLHSISGGRSENFKWNADSSEMSGKLLRIGFIGGGKMAQAMAKGFISADLASLKAFKDLGAESVTENIPVVQKSQIVIVSVKPHIVPIALGDLKDANIDDDKLYLSVAMGVTIKQLEQILPKGSRVIRVMPNTPALVQSGASVFVKGNAATEGDTTITKKLLQSIGTCEEVSEGMMDAVTALSGSGPAYVYLFIEALADGGVKMGLPRDLAYRLAAQTVLGGGKMVRDTKTHPGVLKDDVTSPGGSTATGIHFLEERAFRGTVMGAIEAATKRCKEVAASSH
ncbi:hypothetical protein D910_08050 [Dendroctonus ponderosae]|uniref:Pyrroline-5-carboxylate reductase n=1 Tax=Dendroctonus ponderosae TaxID=77166 RepID=U4UEE5_DENPD|nr:hypothetical protein D910_08050 [Dendroctonus ponderosae]